MQKTIITLLIFISLGAKGDYWTQKASLPGDDRGAAAGFSCLGKGYIGTGIKFSGPTQFHNDLWEYNPVTNSWIQKANFAGTARSGAVGFSLLGKGYIACGYDATSIKQDVWEYNSVTNNWSQKASLPGPGRDYTVAFTIDSFAYIGTGYDANSNNYQDFYEYNPALNAWTAKPNVGGGDRSSAIAFAINGKGYIGAGYNATYLNDFWQYNPITNAWAQKANTPGGGRSDGHAFDLNGKGYIIGGTINSAATKDLWQYNDVSNTWIQKANLTGSARSNAVSFSIDSCGYIGTGYDPVFITLNDFWQYTQDSTAATNATELPIAEFNFQLSPNPCKDFTVVNFGFAVQKNTTLTISNALGKTVYTKQLAPQTSDLRLPTSQLAKGIYTMRVDDSKHSAIKKFVKE